jgi:hypothetical protein
MVVILCEGPSCNGGRSAHAHEGELTQGLRGHGADTRATALQAARASVTRGLHYTPHEMAGNVARCAVCGHARIYG